MRRQIMTITGPSCAGKTTLINQLLKDKCFEIIKTDTTRKKRRGEDETEYNFISKKKFTENKEEGLYAEFNEFAGEMYGTQLQQIVDILDSGKTAVTIVDVNGAEYYKEIAHAVKATHIAVFVNESINVITERWVERIRNSKQESQILAARLLNTLSVEQDWQNDMDIDFLFDVRRYAESELVSALKRIGRGSISIGNIRNMFPKPP